jgi:hypothetical protein
VADRVDGHSGELSEAAVLEPQDVVCDLTEAFVVRDDDDAASVQGG